MSRGHLQSVTSWSLFSKVDMMCHRIIWRPNGGATSLLLCGCQAERSGRRLFAHIRFPLITRTSNFFQLLLYFQLLPTSSALPTSSQNQLLPQNQPITHFFNPKAQQQQYKFLPYIMLQTSINSMQYSTCDTTVLQVNTCKYNSQ